ncbi:hypothetical protein D7X88_07635 [bacterium C-53]|nr:hypothetical protein [Lachnospiraceae bacterium]NBI03088.1 hypothetical protein [Lachnospiraceae bacterium]RKJ10696.1 hypothetical protein D7X88_07635 [bacterium C-53]
MTDLYKDINNEINKLEKRIVKLKNKFSEKLFANNQEIYNAYLKSRANQQLLLEYQTICNSLL